MHNQFKSQKFKHLMLAMGPRDLNSAPYSPVHCSSHSMTSFQSSELTELAVVENGQLFAQRVHSARYAPLQLTHTNGRYHMVHHTRHTAYGASSRRELRAMADALNKLADTLPADSPHIICVWFVVDTTVDTHLLPRISRMPLHKATESNLCTQALLLWKALNRLPRYAQLHIVRQESYKHQHSNRNVDIQALHHLTTHLPALKIPVLGHNHLHIQHLSLKFEPHNTPDWMPENVLYSSHNRAYQYPNPVQHLARVLGDSDSRTHIQELQAGLGAPPCTTRHHAQLTSQHTSRRDASNSSRSNYHSSPVLHNGSPTNTYTSWKNSHDVCAITPPRRIGNTSNTAPCTWEGIP